MQSCLSHVLLFVDLYVLYLGWLHRIFYERSSCSSALRRLHIHVTAILYFKTLIVRTAFRYSWLLLLQTTGFHIISIDGSAFISFVSYPMPHWLSCVLPLQEGEWRGKLYLLSISYSYLSLYEIGIPAEIRISMYSMSANTPYSGKRHLLIRVASPLEFQLSRYFWTPPTQISIWIFHNIPHQATCKLVVGTSRNVWTINHGLAILRSDQASSSAILNTE